MNDSQLTPAKKRIAFSAYYCNPYLASEAIGAFKWLTVLLTKYHVVLITCPESEMGIRRYYKQNLPSHLEMLVFNDQNWLKGRFNLQLHFGYFTFNKGVRKYLKENPIALRDVELILHKNPTSFRYPTSYYLIEKPVVIGPMGGGLQVPPVLKDYFKRESWLNKFRKFDRLLLKLPCVKRAFDKATYLLITLEYLKDILPAKYEDKIKVFFDAGIEINKDFENRVDSSVVKILFVGKLIRFKGVELAIRSVGNIRNKDRLVFDIVGDGAERQYLEHLVKKLELENTVNFHGNVPYEEIDRYYENADIFLYPSLTEASGNVLLEAMKNGLPIISINNGGPRYMCPDEGTIKVAINRPEEIIRDLSANLERLLVDGELRNRMGRVNYEHVKSNYSWEVLTKKIIDMVEEVENPQGDRESDRSYIYE